MSKKNNKKFPTEMVLPIALIAGWILYDGKTFGRNGGASRVDDPNTYWAIVIVLVGFVLYKIVEYFDL